MKIVEVKEVANGYIVRKTHDDTPFHEKAEVGRELVFPSFDRMVGHLVQEFEEHRSKSAISLITENARI